VAADLQAITQPRQVAPTRPAPKKADSKIRSGSALFLATKVSSKIAFQLLPQI
jgi:hypothetical protein